MKAAATLAVGLLIVASSAIWLGTVDAHETTTTTVLFDREIVRILNRRCVMCHAEKSLSFPLETYEETWHRKRSMRAAALARHMPPWSAVPGYGAFSNDNALTLREAQFIVSWAEGNGPRNAGVVFLNVVDSSAARPPEIRAQADFHRWRLGEPALKYKLAANAIAANEPNVIRRTVVDLGLKKETWIRGLEFMPGDRRVLRAASFTLEGTGAWLGSWTPWQSSFALPAGVARRVPAGARVVAELHYRSASEPVIDQGTLGLFVADTPSQRTAFDLVLEGNGTARTAGDRRRVRLEQTVAADTYVTALAPDLRPGIRSMEVSTKTADGATNVLLFLKDIAVDWPTPYILRDPILLRKGTQLSVTAYYDAGVGTAQSTGIGLRVSSYRN
jgi:hypothetical protein